MQNCKVNILGSDYTVIIKKYDEDPAFAQGGIDGYCEQFTRQIVVCDIATYGEWKDQTKKAQELCQKSTLRHEIVHAFLFESGLADSSGHPSEGWAKNEEMVDWFALQGPKIYEAWRIAGAL